MKQYRVWLSSTPGMWEPYDGYVDVWAENDTEAEEGAIRQLAAGAFWDRGRGAWVVDRVERGGSD